MPIKPENKHRYPPDWKQVRAAILKRARHCCEECGVPNHVYRIIMGRDEIWTRNPEQAEAWVLDGERVTRVVITIAHLDHTPEHCDPANLKALCQRCHLAHDRDQHRQTFYATRRQGKALGDLFDADL